MFSETVRLHLKAWSPPSDWPSQSALEDLIEFVRKLYGSIELARRTLAIDGLNQHYLSHRVASLKGLSIDQQQTQIGADLTQIKRGAAPAQARALIDFLWKQKRKEFKEFLEQYGLTDLESLPEAIEYDTFICWSGDLASNVAEKIRDFLANLDEPIRAFMSSKDIQNGELWNQVLEDSLTTSAHGLLIATHSLLDSAYALFEYGALTARGNVPSVWRLSMPQELLPAPIRDRQHEQLSFGAFASWLERISDEIAKRRGVIIEISAEEMESVYSDIQDIVSEHFRSSAPSENRWQHYARPIMIGKQENSPFDLQQAFLAANERLVLIAQNHRFLTGFDSDQRNKHWEMLETALARGVDIDIVGMHDQIRPSASVSKEVPNAFDLWANFMNASSFYEHCAECWSSLEQWSSLASEISDATPNFGRLRIFGAYFTPLTISVIDPDTNGGTMILSPRTNNEANSDRPQFVLRRQFEDQAFSYYWGAVRNSFDNAGWRQLFT